MNIFKVAGNINEWKNSTYANHFNKGYYDGDKDQKQKKSFIMPSKN
jgi:hypothetical protein